MCFSIMPVNMLFFTTPSYLKRKKKKKAVFINSWIPTYCVINKDFVAAFSWFLLAGATTAGAAVV